MAVTTSVNANSSLSILRSDTWNSSTGYTRIILFKPGTSPGFFYAETNISNDNGPAIYTGGTDIEVWDGTSNQTLLASFSTSVFYAFIIRRAAGSSVAYTVSIMRDNGTSLLNTITTAAYGPPQRHATFSYGGSADGGNNRVSKEVCFARVLSDAECISEVRKSTVHNSTPYWFWPNTAHTSAGDDTSGNSRNGTRTGTGTTVSEAPLFPDDSSGFSATLSGSSAGIAQSAGTMTKSISKTQAGSSASISNLAGQLVGNLALAIAGSQIALAVSNSNLIASPSVNSTGSQINVSVDNSDFSIAVQKEIAGSVANLQGLAGALSLSVERPLTGSNQDLSALAGALGLSVAVTAAGSTVGIDGVLGLLSPSVQLECLGSLINISLAAGSFSIPGDETTYVQLTGSEINVTASNGQLLASVSVEQLGQAISVLASISQFIPNVQFTLNGLDLNITQQAGNFTTSSFVSLLGALAQLLVDSGNLIPGVDSVSVLLTGSELSIETFVGQLSKNVEVTQVGSSVNLVVIAGVMFAFTGTNDDSIIVPVNMGLNPTSVKFGLTKTVKLWSWKKS